MNYTNKIQNCLKDEIKDNEVNIILNDDIKNDCSNCSFKDCNFTTSNKSFKCNKLDITTNICKSYNKNVLNLSNGNYKTYRQLKNVNSINNAIQYLKSKNDTYFTILELIKQIKDYCINITNIEVIEVLKNKLKEYNVTDNSDQNIFIDYNGDTVFNYSNYFRQ